MKAQSKVATEPSRVGSLLLLGIVASILVTLRILSAVGSGWADIYDDAYISFRYAANLWDGYGLVWNVGEPPTEGFSNLLLVILIAPFTAFGDPLLASRSISVLSLILLCILLYILARRILGCSPLAAAIAPIVLVLLPATLALVLVGMETLPYALGLLTAALCGVKLLTKGTWWSGATFSLATFAAFLLRPEGGIVFLVVGFLYVVKWALGWRCWKGGFAAVSVFGALLSVYLLWKLAYFGDIFPNPFYIKSSNFGLTASGVSSFQEFGTRYWVLAGMACFGLLIYPVVGRPGLFRKLLSSEGGTLMLVSTLSVVCIVLFFLTADTLADIQGRFLYPAVPLLLVLSVPVFQAIGNLIVQRIVERPILAVLALTALLLGSSGIGLGAMASTLNPIDSLRAIRLIPERFESNRQIQLAQKLKEFDGIGDIKIAYADAGIVPFITQAKWLDPVGLNDSYIARERDLDALVDYYFSQRPDVSILLLDHSGTWATYGHGPLGDYAAWANDLRWDNFEYVGVVKRTDIPYDLVFLVNRSSPQFQALRQFLRNHVVDGWTMSMPADLGSRMGLPNPSWTPSPTS